MGGAVMAQGAAERQGAAGFVSGGARIAVDWFPAAGAGRKPAVIILHGADGLAFPDRYRTAASLIAAQGFNAALVHYFDRTGGRGDYAGLRERVPAWADTVRDAVTFAAAQPGGDPSRIGLVGFSLGGLLALAEATEDSRVKAVVDVFGPLPEGFEGRAKRLPPILILHGEDDRTVPVSNAQRLDAFLTSRGATHELKIYPGQGHGFTGQAQIDAAQRIVGFLSRTLGD